MHGGKLPPCPIWWQSTCPAARRSSTPSRPCGTEATPPSRSTSVCPEPPKGPCSTTSAPAASSTPMASDADPDGRPAETGDALVVATSGTTGTPRAWSSPTPRSRRRPTPPPPPRRRSRPPPLAGLPAPQPRRRPRRRHPGPLTDTPLTVLPGFDAEAVEAHAGPDVFVSPGRHRPRAGSTRAASTPSCWAARPRPPTCRPTRSPPTA